MKDKLWFWLTWKMPRRLVYFCTIRLISAATTGQYSDTVVPELTAMDSVKRWED